MTTTQHDENLFVVFAVEEYARQRKISAHETLGLFLKFGVTESIRQCREFCDFYHTFSGEIGVFDK